MRPPRHAFATAVALVVFAFPFKGSAFDHSDGFSPYGSGYAPDTAPLDAETAITTQLAGLSLGAVGFHNHTAPASAHPRDFGRRDAKDFYLRVMPLGASITQGQASSDQNGYRKHLRDQLRYKGWKVNMVGSLQDGTMADSDHEGHRGWTIEQVTSAWVTSRWMKPNLVLVNVGLNDCLYNVDLSNAGNRMKQLIDQIFDYVPGVTVVLSTLLRSTNPDHDSCTASVNEQYRALFKTYKGARIALADVQSVMSLSDLGPDGDHPTDSGYEMFAGVWWDAISKIEDRIQAPVAVSGIDDSTASSPSQCKKVAGNAPPRVQTQLGSGHDDGNYLHNSINRGILKTANISKGQDPESITKDIPWHIFFANLVVGDVNAGRSQALDDWVRIWHTKEGRNVYYFRQNLGGGKFGDSVEFDVDMDCDDGPRYAFADFNNDGLDDFFCLKGTSVVLSLNRGGNPPTFENMGLVIGDLDGYAATDVRIADIDGDGRADFCLLAADGTIGCSRNGGTDDKPTWQGFSTPTGIRGKVFNEAQTDKAGIVLADLNGDFRSDYMYINDFGNVHTWVNNRGTGSGIVPKWRSAGLTHVGQTDTGIQGNVKFGRIYGSGRLDYVYLKEEEDRFDALVWENRGSGGTKLKADGDFYCDMRGSGSDDYVWIYSDGHAGELNVNIHKPPSWGHSTRIAISVPGPRVAIHLADWDGDGRCDIWVQQKSGLLSVHLNLYDSATDKITFGDAYPVNSNSIAPLCTEGWGVGIFDRGMRLADIDGDGRADILCIEKDGRITAVLNSNGGLLDAGQVKFSEGWDRANIRFADVEASGTADLIHLDKYTGAATVYKNNGIRDTSGSTFSWTNRGVLYNAIDRGENMHFANLGGLGRADLIHTDPSTNKAWTFWNRCSGSGGDDGAVSNPGLPSIGGGSVLDDSEPEGDYPTVVDGFCGGPDCHGGVCIGILCISYGCSGGGCVNGQCVLGTACIPSACIGPDCVDGECRGSGCRTSGCEGDDCDSSSGTCTGDDCVSVGCSGSDCDSGGSGICHGSHCSHHGCSGLNCLNGICIGPLCHDSSHSDGGGCEGENCGGGGGGGGGNDPGGDNCPEPSTVSDCLVVCTTSPTPRPCSTTCFGIVGCGVTATTTTTDVATATPAPGFEATIDDDDTWELPDYDSISANWPSVSATLSSESEADHESLTHTGPITLPSQSPTTTASPYTGTECDYYTTTSQCIGDGSHSACTTGSFCVPTAPCPPAYTAQGTPQCSEDLYCLGTTYIERCAVETGGAMIDRRTAAAHLITSSPVRATPTPAPKSSMGVLPRGDHARALKDGFHLQSKPESESKFGFASEFKSELQSTPGSNEFSLSTTSPNPRYNSSMILDRLFVRQNGCGGSANGGCDLIPFCALCVTVTETPCIQATLSAITGPLSGTDISVFVNEDGAEVCSVTLHCDIWDFDCSGLADVDCGDGYDLSFNWNNVIYYSPKYDRSFPMYLERVKENDFQFCTQKLGLLDLPSGCLGDEYAIESGPCRNNEKREGLLSGTIQTRSELPDHRSRSDIIRQDAAPHLDSFTSPYEANPGSIFRRAYGHFNSPASCGPRAQKLTNWIADTVNLTQAAIDAITDLEANPTVPYPPSIDAIALTMNNLLGVDYTNPNPAVWATVRQNFEAIQGFANGVFSGGRPWIFCGDAWTEPKQWTDWALDSQGKPVPHPQGGTYLQIWQSYYAFYRRSPQLQPYWARDIGDFVFFSPGGLQPGQAGVVAGAICSNQNANPVAVTMHSTLGFPIITICSPMNRGGFDGFTAFPYDTIAQVPIYQNVDLDRYRPGSGTMLHEFMHAVKGAGRAPDRGNNAQMCAQLSIGSNPSDAMNSPECNTLFAVAMWVQRQTANTASPLQFKLLRALPL